MNILLIVFNCIGKLKEFEHSPVVYLLPIESKNKPLSRYQNKRIDFIDYSEYHNEFDFIDYSGCRNELIKQIVKYKDHFDILLFIDHEVDQEIIIEDLLRFKQTLPSDWILNGKRIDCELHKQSMTGSYYEFNSLLVNCSNIVSDDINAMFSSHKNVIEFPCLSKIYYLRHSQCFSIPSLGIKLKNKNGNFLI